MNWFGYVEFFSDEYGYDMVVIGKMGWRRIDIVAQ